MRICVLGSGSGGNCALVEAGGFGLLIDAGRLPMKYINARLGELGAAISGIGAILATHVHGDHVDGKLTYSLCRNRDIPLYVHQGSYEDLLLRDRRFADLERAGLVRLFGDESFPLRRNIWVRPFHVRHGGGGWNRDVVGRPVGFRISYTDGVSEKCVTYATDLGAVPPPALEALGDADAIVLESNHDPGMELASKRPKFLKDWVLGPSGHLSNLQAAKAVFRAVSEGRVRHVVLAHLSEDCNTPELALSMSRRALEAAGADSTVSLCVAGQRQPSGEIIL